MVSFAAEVVQKSAEGRVKEVRMMVFVVLVNFWRARLMMTTLLRFADGALPLLCLLGRMDGLVLVKDTNNETLKSNQIK